jgi:hypothetical protein
VKEWTGKQFFHQSFQVPLGDGEEKRWREGKETKDFGDCVGRIPIL